MRVKYFNALFGVIKLFIKNNGSGYSNKNNIQKYLNDSKKIRKIFS